MTGTAAARALAWSDLLPAARRAVFVATFALAWITLHPFGDLSARETLEITTGNETVNYALFALLAAGAFALLGPRLRSLVQAFSAWPLLALGGWMAVCSLGLSQDPATSVKRLVVTLMATALAAALFLLPRNQKDLALCLALATGGTLLLSYGGVVFAPDYAVHQAHDLVEPQLAGNWRGVFAHKNGAAAVFALTTYMGLFIARSGLPVSGALIAAASAVFVFFSGGKTSTMLLVLSLLASFAWFALARRWLRVAVALAPIVLLNMLSIGTVLVPSLEAVTKALPVDTSFTGRTDVWTFAIDKLQGHLASGFGFQAFWNTDAVRFGSEDASWAGTAAHAHNGYLDSVISMGLPGLALVLAAFVMLPLRDLLSAERRGADPALLAMLAQIWLFGVYQSAMESFFLDRTEPIWITFAFAVFGLRYAAAHRLRGRN